MLTDTIITQKRDHLNFSIQPLNKIDEAEWSEFLEKVSNATFFCTTGWWKTFTNAYFLQIRNKDNKLIAGVPFRILSVLPVFQRHFKSCWLDSSILVADEAEAMSGYEIKKSALKFLLDYLKKKRVMDLTISSKTRSHDGELFRKLFNYSDKCASLIIDLNRENEDIFRSFSKGRKSAIKKAQKMGVEIKILEGEAGYELLPDYCSLENKLFDYKQKIYSNIYYKSETYLRSILSTNKAFVAIAYYNQKPAAGSIIVFHNDNMFYYLGASDILINRETNAASLLKYESILYGKRQNFKTFDLGGIPSSTPDPSNSLYGVYKFKKDFGGERVEFDCSSYAIHKKHYRFVWWLRKLENNSIAVKIYNILRKTES